MATKTISIDSFNLKSSWTYKTRTIDQNGWSHFSNPYASTATKKVTVDLSSIPTGSRITSATLAGQASYGSSRAAYNGVSVNVDGTQNVTSWFTTLASSITIQFSFQYNDPQPPIVQQMSPSSPTYSRTSYFQNLVLTINYELPNSTGKLNKTSVVAQDGESIKLTITPTNASYKHKVTWKLEGATAATTHTTTTTLNAGVTENTWNLSSSFVDAIPSAASKTASVILETLNGGNTLGSVTYTFTVTVPSTIKPSVNIQTGTLTWTNPNNDTFSGELVQGISTARLRLKISDVSAGAGSTIKSVVFSGWGGSKTATKDDTYYYADTGLLTSSGYKTIKVVITDNRGRNLTIEKGNNTTDRFFAVRTYKEPTIDGISVKRCTDQTGQTLDDVGTYMRISADFTYHRINNNNAAAQNSVTIKAKYKRNTVSSYGDGEYSLNWTSSQEAISGNVRNVVNGAYVVVGPISTDYAYDISVTLKDALNKQSTATAVIQTTTYVLHFKNGGTAVGIGQAAGSAKSVVVNPDWNFNMYGGRAGEHTIYKAEIVATETSRKDLNDYVDYGYYAIHSSSAPYIDNCPVDATAGVLIVMSACDDERSKTSAYSYWSAMQVFISRNASIFKRYIRTNSEPAVIDAGTWQKLMTASDTIEIGNTTGTLAVSRGGTGVAANSQNALKTSLGIALGAGSTITFPANTVFPGMKTNSNGNILVTFNLGRPLIGNLNATISGSGWLLTTSGKTSETAETIASMGTARTITCDPSGIVNLNIQGSFGGTNNTPVSLLTSTAVGITFAAAS